MGLDWHPKAIRQPLGYGEYVGGGRPKLLWHTTEGSSYPGPRLYQGTNPHFTLDLRNARLYQHVPLSKASKALKHPQGTGQTNNDNVVQVELVEFAGRSGSWPRGYYAQIASLARWIEANHGVARRSVNFRTQPRLGWQAWHIFSGHLGHRHVPANDHCVASETRILCADLRWRQAGDLRVGDEIIAFDDEPQNESGRIPGDRLLRTAEITAARPGSKPCMEVITADGSVIASEDHPWLTRRPVPGRSRTKWEWVRTDQLSVGDELAFLVGPWEESRSWDGGWIAGMLEADGWCSNRSVARDSGWSVSFGQAEGPSLDRFVDAMGRHSIAVSVSKRTQPRVDSWNRKPFSNVVIGGRAQVLRLLGMFRVPRFMERAPLAELWEGASVAKTAQRSRIEAIVSVGEHPIASLATSTGTFITEGFLTHNTDPGPNFRIDLVLGGNDRLTELRARLARLRASVRRVGRWTPGRKRLAKRLEGQIDKEKR